MTEYITCILNLWVQLYMITGWRGEIDKEWQKGKWREGGREDRKKEGERKGKGGKNGVRKEGRRQKGRREGVREKGSKQAIFWTAQERPVIATLEACMR